MRLHSSVSWCLQLEAETCGSDLAAIVRELGDRLRFLAVCLATLNLSVLISFLWISISRFHLAVNGFTFKYMCHPHMSLNVASSPYALGPTLPVGMDPSRHADLLT